MQPVNSFSFFKNFFPFFQSLNGTFVNGVKLCPEEPRVLNEGDLVQLGVAENAEKPPEFVWKYFTQYLVKKIKTVCKGTCSDFFKKLF